MLLACGVIYQGKNINLGNEIFTGKIFCGSAMKSSAFCFEIAMNIGLAFYAEIAD